MAFCFEHGNGVSRKEVSLFLYLIMRIEGDK